jgi:hypothetical protein
MSAATEIWRLIERTQCNPAFTYGMAICGDAICQEQGKAAVMNPTNSRYKADGKSSLRATV